ncbi:MAG: hypothetical protein HZB24_03820 [Desulfobacterales bacterium]|nr:hypothetical protein [Desulfobacterales bacterium]
MSQILTSALKYFPSAKSRRILLVILICAWGIYLFPMFYGIFLDKTCSDKKVEKLFASIKSKYGIEIVYDVDADFLSDIGTATVPAGPPPQSKVIPIRRSVLIRYPEILESALTKYPVQVIKNYLNAIHFARKINHDGFLYAGSFDPFRRVIFIVDNGAHKPEMGVATFHHEFSSLLLSRHSLVLNPWLEQNPKGFKYLYDTDADKLKTFNNSSLNGTAPDYENGFMNTYGQTDFENDFNEYSAMIFTYPGKFKQIMARHPRVRGKFLVWLKFYQVIDPIFTEEYLLGAKAQGE